MRKLREMMAGIDECFVVDTVTVGDVYLGGVEFKEKVSRVERVEGMLERIRGCKTAHSVFTEFAVDAAAAKVDEMLNGKTSEARQRAAETVLEYALGKPINRNLSLSARVAEVSEEELDHEIRRYMADLGFSEREGASTQLLVGVKGSKGGHEVIEVSAKSGVSEGICSEHKEGEDMSNGEPGGQGSKERDEG